MTLLASPPDDAILRAFLLGTLSPDVSANVSTWVESDRTAAERLRGIDAHDTVVDAIGNAAETDTSPYISSQAPPVVSEIVAVPLPTEVGGYRILGELGRGGMGIVLEAEDIRLKRRVAIKLIAAMLASNPASRERFLREARAVATIEHENVVPILHVGEDAGQLYLVMPLLKGETLNARLRREKQLPTGELVRIGLEVAAGLAAAHVAGLVHRDVKPGNIWLEAGSGRVKLLDFGLAKPLDSATDANLTDIGAVMGTPHYMAPEQAEGKAVDSRADLFSLGAVLYHAAAGRRPFQGETKLAILIAVLHDTPLQLEKLNANLSPQLVALIRSLLEKDPAKRYASAEAVVDALRRIARADSLTLTDAPTDTALFRPSILESSIPLRLPTPKRRRVWPIVAVVVAVVGIGIAMSGLPWIKTPVETPYNEKLLPPKAIVTIGTHDRRHRGEVFDTSPTLGLAITLNSADGVKLWDTGTLKVKASCHPATFGEHPPRFGVILNAEWLAGVAYPGKLYLLKVVANKIELHHTYDIPIDAGNEQLAASPDGNWLAFHVGTRVYVWSREQLQQRRPASSILTGCEWYPDGTYLPVPFVRFSNDSKSLGVVTRAGVRVTTLDAGGWKETAVLPIKDFVASFAFDDGAKTVYLAAAKFDATNPGRLDRTPFTIQQWSVANGQFGRAASIPAPAERQPGRIELNAGTGIVLGQNANEAATFSYRDGLKPLQQYINKFGLGGFTNSRLIANGEFLTLDEGVMRKYRLNGKDLTEVDPLPHNNNVWQIDRSLFGRFGSRVLIVGREPGSPVRVWELNEGKAEKVFERKSKFPLPESQQAVLSPNGREVLIAEANQPPVVWGFDDKNRQVANTTFGTAALQHEPLGLTTDGKYVLMMQLGGEFLTVWQRDKLDAPIAKYKVEPPAGEAYRGIKVFTVKDGWRVCFLGDSKNTNIADPIDIEITGPTPTFRKDARIQSGFSYISVRENLTLSCHALAPNGAQLHWVIEDRGQKPNVETLIPFPADFQAPSGIALSPNGNILLAYSGTGRVILFDRTTKKTVWDYQFPGGVWAIDFVDDETHLMIVHADGVVEIVDSKEEKR